MRKGKLAGVSLIAVAAAISVAIGLYAPTVAANSIYLAPAYAFSPFTLPAGQSLTAGDMVLAMKTDGDLVLYRNGKTLWASGTGGRACSSGCGARFQSDGNLVLYENYGASSFRDSGSSGHYNTSLILTAAAPYISIGVGQTVVWAGSNEFAPFTLPANNTITVNGLTLRMQSDGNLVLVQNDKMLWDSGTSGLQCSGCVARFQTDGNLVLVQGTSAYWGKGTWQNPNSTLRLTATAPYVSVINRPLVGATVHTAYVDASPHHWDWYKNSSTYWDFAHMQPLLGFYVQTGGSTIQQNHYAQLQRAQVDYALMSWFGGISDLETAAINQVLDTYFSVFTANNWTTNPTPIRLAVLMEFASTNYQTRLDYLKTNVYDKYPAFLLTFEGRPIIALSFRDNDPAKGEAIAYAQCKGFYVKDSTDAAGGGSIFGGITMKTDNPNRTTSRFAGGVSPGVDITGKDYRPLEAECLTRGCGTLILDGAASNGAAIESNGSNCDVVWTGSATANFPTVAQDLTEWYAIFRIKTSDVVTVKAMASVVDSCGNKYEKPISSATFGGNNQYVHVPVQFSHLQSTCAINARVSVTSGNITVDRLWMTTCQFRKPSIAEFDAQWQEIKNRPLASRPKFITVASFNAWEEGTAIESNTYFGTQFLDRTAYWSDQVKTE